MAHFVRTLIYFTAANPTPKTFFGDLVILMNIDHFLVVRQLLNERVKSLSVSDFVFAFLRETSSYFIADPGDLKGQSLLKMINTFLFPHFKSINSLILDLLLGQ